MCRFNGQGGRRRQEGKGWLMSTNLSHGCIVPGFKAEDVCVGGM